MEDMRTRADISHVFAFGSVARGVRFALVGLAEA